MRLALLVCVMAFLPCLAAAKRIPPAKVAPVVYENIRYVAPNDESRRAYIEAWDIQTNSKLWDLTVFTNRIDPKLEEDVQWVFISELSLRDGTFIVKSERGTTYQVDLRTKAITECDAARSPAPGKTGHPPDIPELIDRAITNGSLAKNYDVSFHMNPAYLRGDFNGDGEMDIAVLVKQRSTGKVGIAIINGASDKITILGGGTAIGNGGDDFEWMDSWEIYSKDRMANGKRVPKLRGDALLVSQSEAASALIYWNGMRYVWLQQGD
ncbi:MAG: hypothetical protein Udaeo2_26120 [Candidatus Udaeobacter sp.]|nr:MAG: hypothetical protein Udaeo2_26120 [Candidatus Udaeobacter sp.]